MNKRFLTFLCILLICLLISMMCSCSSEASKGTRENPFVFGEEITFTTYQQEYKKGIDYTVIFDSAMNANDVAKEYEFYDIDWFCAVRATISVKTEATDNGIYFDPNMYFLTSDYNKYNAALELYVPNTLNCFIYDVYNGGMYDVIVYPGYGSDDGPYCYVTIEYYNKKNEVETIWVSLPDEIVNGLSIEDYAIVDEVESYIDRIGTVSIDSGAVINFAKNKYNNLSDEIKAHVTNFSKLEEAEKAYTVLVEKKNVEDVEDTINSIESIGKVSLDSESIILESREKYEALPQEYKALVTNYGVLESAESEYYSLVVDEVINCIDTIGTVTLDSEPDILNARSMYNALSDDNKERVSNYDDLETAETEYKSLVADEVIKSIHAIGEVTIYSENSINDARQKYNQLPEDIKPLVTNYDVLESAEQAFIDVSIVEMNTVYFDSLLSNMPLSVIETKYTVQDERYKTLYPDMLQAVIKNYTKDDIKNAVVAFVAWDKNNLPVKIKGSIDFSDGAYVKKVNYGDINLTPGDTYGHSSGYEIDENCGIERFKAIVVSFETFDGDTWENPYYDEWLELYEGKKYSKDLSVVVNIEVATFGSSVPVNSNTTINEEDTKISESELFSQIEKQQVRVISTEYVVQDTRYKTLYPDMLRAVLKNDTKNDIKNAVVAFVAWDKNNLPVKLKGSIDFSDGSYIKKVDYGDINLVPGGTFGESHGFEIEENCGVDKFKAIVVEYETFDGETWYNPLYEDWCRLYEGVKLS